MVEESSSSVLSADQERELGEAAVRLALRPATAGRRPSSSSTSPIRACSRSWRSTPASRSSIRSPRRPPGWICSSSSFTSRPGGRLEGEPPTPVGHAIEARINAEDPALGFAPAPGRIALLRLPADPGIRIDAGMSEGDSIPAEFDSMIAKLIAWGRDRTEALARLRRALAETTIVVEGGTTNVGFLLELLARPELRAGEVDTGWLDRLQLSGETISARHAEVALVAAAVELADAQTRRRSRDLLRLRAAGAPRDARLRRSREVELRYHGQRYRLAVSEIGPSLYRVTLDGISVEVERGAPEPPRAAACSWADTGSGSSPRARARTC